MNGALSLWMVLPRVGPIKMRAIRKYGNAFIWEWFDGF